MTDRRGSPGWVSSFRSVLMAPRFTGTTASTAPSGAGQGAVRAARMGPGPSPEGDAQVREYFPDHEVFPGSAAVP